jgi:hypothetical protein
MHPRATPSSITLPLDMISLLVFVLLALLILALIWYVLTLLPLPQPAQVIVWLILALLVLLGFLRQYDVLRI